MDENQAAENQAAIVGVTGKCCAGKDAVASYLSHSSWHTINVDYTGHRALQEERAALEAAFGDAIFSSDGSVDRKALGEIVFSDSRKMRTLEAIVHPRMREIVEQSARYYSFRGKNVAINAALLFVMDLHRMCDHVLVVKAPLCLRIKRARQRDGWTYMQILQRFWSQRRLFPNKKTKNVDMYSVWNSQDLKTLHQGVEEFLTMIERQG